MHIPTTKTNHCLQLRMGRCRFGLVIGIEIRLPVHNWKKGAVCFVSMCDSIYVTWPEPFPSLFESAVIVDYLLILIYRCLMIIENCRFGIFFPHFRHVQCPDVFSQIKILLTSNNNVSLTDHLFITVC